MIDMIGAIAGTAVYALLVGVLVGLSPVGGPTKLAVPAMLVPLYLLIHLAVAAKLRSLQPTTRAVAMAR